VQASYSDPDALWETIPSDRHLQGPALPAGGVLRPAARRPGAIRTHSLLSGTAPRSTAAPAFPGKILSGKSWHRLCP